MDERQTRRACQPHPRVKDGTAVRATAATTLDRIVRSGAYSNIVVHGTDLSERDRSAHQNLVFTALRWLIPMDAAITAASSRPTAKIDPIVLSALRIAATELLVLGHSAHGVVDGAVDAVDELGMARAKGYVNAVARSLASEASPDFLAKDSFPSWMNHRLGQVFDDVDDLFAALNAPARPGLRARGGSTLDASPVAGIQGAFYATAETDVESLASSGTADIVDPASIAVANALDVDASDMVADLAAAPGGKTRALADRLGENGLLVASDRHRTRLTSAQRRSADYDHIEWVRMDASRPAYSGSTFHKVLLDAPCTGLGTVRRRPEIRHRITPDAPQRYGEVQRAMLVTALELVAPGGRLVYSVCTFFPEETTDAIANLGGRPPDMSVGDIIGDGRMLTPLNPGTDGMFIAVFDR